MRFVFCLVLLVGIIAGSHAQAQVERQPVYNSTTYKSRSKVETPTIYNSTSNRSSSSRSSAAPISIKNLTRQQRQSQASSRGSSTRPYGFDNVDSRGRAALSLTPADIRAKQQSDRRAAQDRADQARQQREQRQAALQERQNGSKAAQYKSQFQDEGQATQTRKRRSVYRQGEDASPIPRPVFNQVR